MLYGSVPVHGGSLDYKLFAGRIPMSPTKGVAEFVNNEGYIVVPGVRDLEMDSVLGGQLTWASSVDGLAFVYSYSKVRDFFGARLFVYYPGSTLSWGSTGSAGTLSPRIRL